MENRTPPKPFRYSKKQVATIRSILLANGANEEEVGLCVAFCEMKANRMHRFYKGPHRPKRNRKESLPTILSQYHQMMKSLTLMLHKLSHDDEAIAYIAKQGMARDELQKRVSSLWGDAGSIYLATGPCEYLDAIARDSKRGRPKEWEKDNALMDLAFWWQKSTGKEPTWPKSGTTGKPTAYGKFLHAVLAPCELPISVKNLPKPRGPKDEV